MGADFFAGKSAHGVFGHVGERHVQFRPFPLLGSTAPMQAVQDRRSESPPHRRSATGGGGEERTDWFSLLSVAELPPEHDILQPFPANHCAARIEKIEVLADAKRMRDPPSELVER